MKFLHFSQKKQTNGVNVFYTFIDLQVRLSVSPPTDMKHTLFNKCLLFVSHNRANKLLPKAHFLIQRWSGFIIFAFFTKKQLNKLHFSEIFVCVCKIITNFVTEYNNEVFIYNFVFINLFQKYDG